MKNEQIKGKYRSDYYVSVLYEKLSDEFDSVINHEFAHAELTEHTAHGLAMFELIQLMNENQLPFLMYEYLALRDAAVCSEECYAMMMNLLNVNSERDFFIALNKMKDTEYYRRYRINRFDEILQYDISFEKKNSLIRKLIYVAMNTTIFESQISWEDNEELTQFLLENSLSVVPDKRLKKLINWVNDNLSSKIFSYTEDDFHKRVFNEEGFSEEKYIQFAIKITELAERKGLIKNSYTPAINIRGISNLKIRDRLIFYFPPSGYQNYRIMLPDLQLCECDLVKYYKICYENILVFYNQLYQERYILSLPCTYIVRDLFSKYEGTIVAFIDDYEVLEGILYESHTSATVIYNSICNKQHLLRELEKRKVDIQLDGYIEYDNNIGCPIFIDSSDKMFLGGISLLSDDIYKRKNRDTSVLSWDSYMINRTGISKKELLVLISEEDIGGSNDPHIIMFNNGFNRKVLMEEIKLSNRDIAGYYFAAFKSSIVYSRWNDGIDAINFIINLFDDVEDKKIAIEKLDNILTLSKQQKIINGCISQSDAKGMSDLYSILLQFLDNYDEFISERRCILQNNLVNLYIQSGNLVNALELSQYNLLLRQKVFGKRSIPVAKSYYQIGLICLRYGQRNDAYNQIKQAAEIALENKDISFYKISIKLLKQI